MITKFSAARGTTIHVQITFNGGGHWQDLAKPQHYRHGVCDQCANRGDRSSCKLHLHGPSSWHDGPGEGRLLPHRLCTQLQQPCKHFHRGYPRLQTVPSPAGGRPSFYSHENAPGIVMAVGNTGEFLEFAADAMCTWLSRDGGATWEDVAPNAVRLLCCNVPVCLSCADTHLSEPTASKPDTCTHWGANCHSSVLLATIVCICVGDL